MTKTNEDQPDPEKEWRERVLNTHHRQVQALLEGKKIDLFCVVCGSTGDDVRNCPMRGDEYEPCTLETDIMKDAHHE